jgi:hypothetical protein
MERTNTDLDLIDIAIDDLHDILKTKKDGVGLIRVHEQMPIAEYYSTLKDTRQLPREQNLVMTMVKDNLDRKTIRQVCYVRYEAMTRNED